VSPLDSLNIFLPATGPCSRMSAWGDNNMK
jgi:hypothetical protein